MCKICFCIYNYLHGIPGRGCFSQISQTGIMGVHDKTSLLYYSHLQTVHCLMYVHTSVFNPPPLTAISHIAPDQEGLQDLALQMTRALKRATPFLPSALRPSRVSSCTLPTLINLKVCTMFNRHYINLKSVNLGLKSKWTLQRVIVEGHKRIY